MLQWAREHGCELNEEVCNAAAAGEHGCQWDENTCTFAALGGYLGVAVGAGAPLPVVRTTCSLVAKNGHLDVLLWALERGCP